MTPRSPPGTPKRWPVPRASTARCRRSSGGPRSREPRLSALQRLAVVDAAAGWLQQDAGDELAFALLGAVCSTDITTSQTYVALLAPPPAEDAAPEPAP